MVGEDSAGIGGDGAGREAGVALDRRACHAQREAEIERQLQVDVEELGAQLQGAHVRVEVAHIEAPQDRPLDLGPALPPDLVEVGVVPHVLDACAGTRRRRRGARARA